MSNASKRTRVIVGLFSLGLLTVALVLAFQGSSLFDSGRSVEAEFVDVLNVVPQSSEVRVAGVTVGKATAVESEGGMGVVTMSVGQDVDLRADASARLRVKSFLGEKYIDIDPGTAEAPLRGRIELARTLTSADLGGLLGTAGESLDIPPEEITETLKLGNETIQAYGEDLGNGIAGARETLDRMVANRAELFALLDRTDALLSTLVGQQDTIANIIARTDATIGQTQDFVDANRPLFDSVLADVTTLQVALERREGDLRVALEGTPTTLRLTRKLVNQLVANISCGGNPVPVGIDGLGDYLASDNRPPEKTPGETRAC